MLGEFIQIHGHQLFRNCLTQVGLNIFQEYGITRDEKLGVAHSVCARLLRNIKGDLRHADSSDIHTRLNPE